MCGFKNKKSPGPDGLKPIIFKHLPDNIIREIEFIYKLHAYKMEGYKGYFHTKTRKRII